jgi:hypothetical protein
MNLLIAIILISPGLIALKLFNFINDIKKENFINLIIKWSIFSFFIYFIEYITITLF